MGFEKGSLLECVFGMDWTDLAVLCVVKEIVRCGERYFRRWSEINAANSAASTTPSRVRTSLPRAKKCVVG